MTTSISRTPTLLLGSVVMLLAAVAPATVLSQASATVRVDGGELQGSSADGVTSFKGIPFAAPPVGDRRWRPPQAAPRWTGVPQAVEALRLFRTPGAEQGKTRREQGQLCLHGPDRGAAMGEEEHRRLSASRGGAPTPEDRAVSRMVQSYWVNFARTADPNGTGLPVWPRHDPKKDLIFDFRPDGTAGAGPDPRKARLDVTQKATDAGKRADF